MEPCAEHRHDLHIWLHEFLKERDEHSTLVSPVEIDFIGEATLPDNLFHQFFVSQYCPEHQEVVEEDMKTPSESRLLVSLSEDGSEEFLCGKEERGCVEQAFLQESLPVFMVERKKRGGNVYACRVWSHLTIRAVEREYGYPVELLRKIWDFVRKESLAPSKRIGVGEKDELYPVRIVHFLVVTAVRRTLCRCLCALRSTSFQMPSRARFRKSSHLPSWLR